MPTPLGHALAGLSLAWALRAMRARATPGPGAAGLAIPAPGGKPAGRRSAIRIAVFCVVLAAAPDLDILAGSHRTMSHSLGGAALAGVAAAPLAPWLGLSALHAGLLGGSAWGSHVVLDWLGKDSREPHGIMALWPFTRAFYTSGLDVFAEVSRRWWIPEQFILGNLQSVARELIVLGPVALVAWRLARRRARDQ